MFGTASLNNSTLACTYCLVFPLSGKKLYQDLKEKFGKKKLPPFQKGHMACPKPQAKVIQSQGPIRTKSIIIRSQ